MPIVPEKRQLGSQVQGALGSQFWSQGVQSAQVLTGRTSTVPCEPQPLPLCTPAGLSRTQFLVATQAAGVPLFPAYCGDQGGLVADRVLAQSGGHNWWAALVGRAKLQRAFKQRRTKEVKDIIADPDNYELGVTSRIQLGSDTVLAGTLLAHEPRQVPDRLRDWHASRSRRGTRREAAAAGSSAADRPAPQARPAASAALQLRQRFEKLELTAELGLNAPEAQSVRGYRSSPLALSLDVTPRSSSKQRWLQYRLGVRSALAPLDGSAGAGSPQLQQQQQQGWQGLGSRLYTHMQGALAMQGEAVLWQAAQKPWQAPKVQQQRPLGHWLGLAPGKQAPPGPAKEDAGDGAHAKPAAQLVVEPMNGDAAVRGAAGAPREPATAAKRSGNSASSSSSSSTSDAAARSARAPLSRRAAKLPAASSSSGAGTAGSIMDADTSEIDAGPLITPAQIQDALQGSAFWLERLRTDLQVLAGRIDSGEMRRRLGQQQQAEDAPGKCWSSFLPAPHVKVSGLVGLVTRVPLGQPQPSGRRRTTTQQPQQQVAASPAKAATPAKATPRLGSRSSSQQRLAPEAAEAGGSAGSSEAAPGTPSCMARLRKEVPSVVDRLLLQGLSGVAGAAKSSVLRGFASGGASMQFGQMRRSVLDFTRLEARVDVGLTSERLAADASSGAQPSLHPAFALEQRGAWHALTLSVCQQLLGPVRLCGDFRFALESEAPCPRGSSLLKPAAPLELAKHVVGMRPGLIEQAFGLDVVVPGSQGLARAVAWYAPLRKEAMLELRLL